MRSQRFSMLCKAAILVGATVAGVLRAPSGVMAQAIKELQTPDTPLVLKAQGSFFVGGDKADQTQVELGGLGPGGHIAVNQMYVRYMVPQGGDGNVPVVMLHGAALTGKSWETTPDGRMGWDEYFVRKGHPVYVPDQVGRGRSGFNQALFNNVRAGSAPAANLPPWLRFSDEVVWPNFRFGSKPGEPFPDSQFPVTAVDELSKQGVPDVSFGGVPTPNPTFKALSDLAGQLNGAVLMGHSQSGRFPLEAALLNPTAARGLVLVEPGVFPSKYTDEQVKMLATVPVLVVFGDHRDTPTGISSRPSWQLSFDGCQELISRLKAAGGQAQMLDPAARGIRGNSHMIMQDKNSLQIADLILQWIDQSVSKRRAEEQVNPCAVLSLLLASGATGVEAKGEHLTPDDTIQDLLNHPAFAGFGRLLLPWDDRRYDNGMRLRHVGSLLPYHSHVDAETVVSALNHMVDDVNDGRTVFYDFYTEKEKDEQRAKSNTGLFFFRGKPGAPFAVIAPGGGFSYVASIHEGFPYAVAISKQGYNAFVLKYRAGSGGALATRDLAAAISYVFRNAKTLGVGIEAYSLWGSSAGARMAAAIGSHGIANFGGDDLPKPAAVVMAYTGHSEVVSDEPSTFVVVGEHDGIAPPSVMEKRVAALRRSGAEVEFHRYRGLGHGFGPGSGTSAEGWLDLAVRFWEKAIRSRARSLQPKK